MSQGQKKGSPILSFLIIGAIIVAVFFVVNRKQEIVEEAPKAVAKAEKKVKEALSDLPMFAPEPKEEEKPQATPGFENEPTEPEDKSSVKMSVAPPQTDRILTTDFVSDLTNYMVQAYQPAKTRDNTTNRGTVTLTFKKLNMRYGVDMTGLNVTKSDISAARTEAYGHLMSPIVLRLAYGLFSQPFIDSLAQTAASKSRDFASASGYKQQALQDWHVREMMNLYASMVADAGVCFKKFASRPDLVDVMHSYHDAVASVNSSYQLYSDREAMGASKEELDQLSKQVQIAIQAREDLKKNLVSGIKLRPGALIDDADILSIASWVYRRLSENPDSINAIGAIASLSQELATTMRDYKYPPEG